MRKLIASCLRDESGAVAAEYALVLTIMGTAMYVGMTTLGTDISTAFNAAGTVVSNFSF